MNRVVLIVVLGRVDRMHRVAATALPPIEIWPSSLPRHIRLASGSVGTVPTGALEVLDFCLLLDSMSLQQALLVLVRQHYCVTKCSVLQLLQLPR